MHTPSQVHGRRLGRRLSPSRRAALEALLPALSVPEGQGPLDPRALFGDDRPLTLEIGFGSGEHLLDLMRARPDHGFIGAEPYVNGMSAFLKALADDPAHPRNARVHMGDALALVGRLPDARLEAIYILNPDPWPKARHHKRRMVRAETAPEFARVLRPGGRLVMTTDVDDLAGWMVARAARCLDLRWTARSKADWEQPPPGWAPTRYEAKGTAAGRRQTYLIFERR